MKVMVVGPDDPMQKKLLENVMDAIHELQLECKLDVIHKMKEVLKIEERQIILTPALIVNDKIICQGHIWSKEHIKHFLQKECSKDKSSK